MNTDELPFRDRVLGLALHALIAHPPPKEEIEHALDNGIGFIVRHSETGEEIAGLTSDELASSEGLCSGLR